MRSRRRADGSNTVDLSTCMNSTATVSAYPDDHDVTRRLDVVVPTVDEITALKRTRKKKKRSRKTRRGNKLIESEAGHSHQQQRKLFIGQLPIHVDERHLRPILEPFGKIIQLKFRRDKNTGLSERCCFVTFVSSVSASHARQVLHNATSTDVDMPGILKPLQVKFADYCSNYRQRKIFIGMISKHLTEADLTAVFSVFGDIEECVVTRDGNGQSKGSAFITYDNKLSASSAIQQMHQSRNIPGCQTPIVVRLADWKSAKILKKLDKHIHLMYTSKALH